ncbi:MAG: cell division protein FtsA [Bacteroidia bacterium]|nr:cell division protein FtsA [Bacteroidia bacterium]MDG2450250.1 cell division protein FtsA [Saprospiraceae bacterium]
MSEIQEKIIVGLDIGTTKVCAIVGRANQYGKVDILGMGKVASHGGVTRGVVSNIDRTVAAIQAAIKEASEKSNVDIQRVEVGIAGAHISSLQHRGMIIRNDGETEINADDLKKLENDMFKLAVKPGDRILHVIPQEYTVDDEPGIIDPIGMAGVKVEGNFHIITGQISAAKNIHKCVEKSNLEVSDIALEPLASSEAVLSSDELEAGVVLVDIGGGTTDVAIFHDNIICHTAVIPYGGNIITEDIKQGCNVMKAHAELLKVKFGSALANELDENEIVTIPGIRGRAAKEISVKNLSMIIQARIQEIMELVDFEIKHSGVGNIAGGIVITGGGSQLKHVDQLAEFVTGLDARIGYPNEHLAKGMVEEVKSPIYATGVGLVLRGLAADRVSGGDNNDQRLKPSGEKGGGIFTQIKKWLKDEVDVEDFKQ